MAAKSTNYDTALLNLIFNATVPSTSGYSGWNALVANAAAPAANLYVSLHTATLTAAAVQTTSEAGYSGYARVPVARTSGGWIISGASVSPASPGILFPAATGGSETEVAFAIGTQPTGAGMVLYYGTISPTIAVSNGVTPQLTTASTVTEQ